MCKMKKKKKIGIKALRLTLYPNTPISKIAKKYYLVKGSKETRTGKKN